MDEVGSGVNKVKDTVDRLVPVFEEVLLIFNGFEINDPIDSIDSARYRLQIVQAAQLLLAVIPLHLQQLAHTIQSQLTIVFTDYTDIVLNEHTLQLGSVMLYLGNRTSWLGKLPLKSWKLSRLYWSS